MTIPDSIISKTIAWEHQANQQRATIDTDTPAPRRRPDTPDRRARLLRQIADTLHSIANRIEQEPAGSR